MIPRQKKEQRLPALNNLEKPEAELPDLDEISLEQAKEDAVLPDLTEYTSEEYTEEPVQDTDYTEEDNSTEDEYYEEEVIYVDEDGNEISEEELLSGDYVLEEDVEDDGLIPITDADLGNESRGVWDIDGDVLEYVDENETRSILEGQETRKKEKPKPVEAPSRESQEEAKTARDRALEALYRNQTAKDYEQIVEDDDAEGQVVEEFKRKAAGIFNKKPKRKKHEAPREDIEEPPEVPESSKGRKKKKKVSTFSIIKTFFLIVIIVALLFLVFLFLTQKRETIIEETPKVDTVEIKKDYTYGKLDIQLDTLEDDKISGTLQNLDLEVPLNLDYVTVMFQDKHEIRECSAFDVEIPSGGSLDIDFLCDRSYSKTPLKDLRFLFEYKEKEE